MFKIYNIINDRQRLRKVGFLLLGAYAVLSNSNALASGSGAHSNTIHFGTTFAMFAILLVAGKVGNFVERYGQPAVLGELFAGMFLAALSYFGLGFISEISSDSVIAFIAQFGALLLLFSIGLESNLTEMKKVGFRALLVALIGVIVPFILGAFILSPLLFSGISFTTRLFFGASLVATSVGITASVFRSLGIEKTRAAKTVIGAAVIDDVLGLLVLAIVSALAAGDAVTGGVVGVLVLKSFGFIAIALLLGNILAKPLSKIFSKIHTGLGMKVTLAVSIALLFGFAAEKFGLEPIIGAFAAGLVLDAVHFNDFADPEIINDLKIIELKNSEDEKALARVIGKHRHANIEDLVNGIGYIFIPIFFVFAGLQIDFGSLLKPELYVLAAIISVAAIIGKLVAGIAMNGSTREKLLVGAAMVPRGEVGLVFAATGASLGVLSADQFSVLIIVIIVTTFIAPFAIKKLANQPNITDLPASRNKKLFDEIFKRQRFQRR